MTPERWEQVKQIYDSALEREPGQRVAWLDKACAGDEALRREVESLLAYESRADNFIEAPALEVAAGLLAREPADRAATVRQLGPYQTISLLGAGGMGEVYLAEDMRLGRKVALKLLPARFVEDAGRVRRFEREARAASALNHPNIITIHEIGQSNDVHYIVTEYVEGQTLREALSTRMKLPAALDVVAQVAGALAAAHEAGIVHRDIKPENIMLRRDGYVKVLDFGLAKLTEPQAPAPGTEALTVADSETEAGVVMGTASYMSPEQARAQKVDARTDIFSLGVVFYELIAGVAPFAAATGADVIAAILGREPAALAHFAPEVPEALEWVVNKALRKDREERYQTAGELLSDLRGLRRQLEFAEESGRPAGGGVVRVEPEAVSAPPGTIPAGRQSKVINSLAILPLAGTAADPAMEYFGDGITESIINTLSRLPELRVMAWSTVSRYKGRQIDPRDVGRHLGVRAVLTGRVLQPGDDLIIRTELVDAADGSSLWGESYSCKPSDIFRVEVEISREISEKLLLRLTTEERNQLARRYTDNVEAYHAYLKGRYFWNKRTEESLRQGIEYFRRAIDRDPCYALAYVGLADSYINLGAFGIAMMPPAEAFPIAREAAAKALEIDDTLAEAHAPLAFLLANYYWDWPAAEGEFRRAFALKPDYPTAHHWYGLIYLVAMGRLDEAIAEVRRAHELDPLSLPISTNTGFLLYLARRYDEAIEQFRKTLELDRSFAYSHWQMALAYEEKGMYEEAMAGYQQAIALSGRSTSPLALLGRCYAVSGERGRALAVIDELMELSKRSYVSPYRVAAIYAGLGEAGQAFEWLERAYEDHDSWLIWLNADPVFDVIRPDPRFTNLLRRIGLGGDSQPAEAVSHSAAPTPPRAARSHRRPPRKAITSLAILPLANTSDDPGMEYLSDGITESIINTLSQLPGVRVVARGTVFRYKAREVDPQEAGRELGVQAVLTGRVRQIADRLIVSAELTDVASDSQLWGEQYNRNLSDIFEVQEEITKEITGKLRLKLSRREKGRLAVRHTHDVEAYQVYLRGRYFWNKRTTESLHKGIEYFRQAIDLDPGYAPAYTGLSDSWTLLVVREAIPPEDGFAKAKAAAAMALKIDEESAEAHASLGHAMLHNWEWEAAEKELKRAIGLNPGYPSAHHWYSEYLTAMGRCDESIAELKLAGELDPLSLVISADLGRAFYYARDYNRVMEQEARTLEMDPDFWLSHINVGRSYLQKGMHAEAISALQKARELSADNTEALSFLGFAYAAAGKRDEALGVLRELDEQSKRGGVPPYHFAVIHAGLGEKDQAFGWLERSFEKHAVDLFTLKVEPMFDGLRSDPRFKDLLRRTGLAPSPQPVRRATPRHIAVLPFRPLSRAGRDEYLELGMADALITKLSDISQVVVRPTSSVRRYTDLDQDPITAGTELGVESVLEGSIQKLGDRIRVTARLVNVEDGRALWAGKFDEEFTDIFAVEDSISEKVAAALALKLTGEERARLMKRYTENTEAYHLYLKGRFYWNKRAFEGMEKSIECFQQAIALDPRYALAYAGLADSYAKLGDVGVTAIPPKEAFARARVAAGRATEIDSTLAEAHTSLAHLNMHTYAWAEAEKEFRLALELSPNYATAHHWYAYFLIFNGRPDEALVEITRALELDPLSLPIQADIGELLYFARRYDQAVGQLRKALDLDPHFLQARMVLARAWVQKEMYEEALAELHRARAISADNTEALASLGHASAVSGRRDEALRVLDELNELSAQTYVSPYDLAVIHTSLGERDRAFTCLDRACEEQAAGMIYLTVDPRLGGLHSDSRFAGLLQRAGLAHLRQTSS